MTENICALCLHEKTLQNSHLIPKFVFRNLQKDGGGTIHIENNSATLVDKQIKQKFLCEDCENLFSKYESYVKKIVMENDEGNLRLLDSTYYIDEDKKILAIVGDNIDLEKIIFFAASILWRTSAMRYGCPLGVYENEFRNFLFKNKLLPNGVVLYMKIIESSSMLSHPSLISSFPVSEKKNDCWVHQFIICGLVFRFYIGKKIDEELKKFSLLHNNNRFVLRMPAEKNADVFEMMKMTRDATPRGKLARDLNEGK